MDQQSVMWPFWLMLRPSAARSTCSRVISGDFLWEPKAAFKALTACYER
jgi:hypothetical protein